MAEEERNEFEDILSEENVNNQEDFEDDLYNLEEEYVEGEEADDDDMYGETEEPEELQAQGNPFANIFSGFGDMLNVAAQEQKYPQSQQVQQQAATANLIQGFSNVFTEFGDLAGAAQSGERGNRRVDPSELMFTKKNLKKVDLNQGRRRQGIGFKEFYEDFNQAEYKKFPEEAIHYLPVESIVKVIERTLPPPSILDFKGLDMLTDFVFEYLMRRNEEESLEAAFTVTAIDCSGCRYLTDEGILRMVHTFKYLKEVVLDACPLLTEMSLLYLLDLEEIEVISMKATAVSVVTFSLKDHPQLKHVNLEGCPLHTPFPSNRGILHSITSGDIGRESELRGYLRELTANHKVMMNMVVLNMYTPFGFTHWLETGEKKENQEPFHYLPACEVNFPINTPDGRSWDHASYNILEISEGYQGFEHLFLSESNLIVIPFLLSKFSSQDEVQKWILSRHIQLSKYKPLQIVFACISDGRKEEKDKHPDDSAVEKLFRSWWPDVLLEKVLQDEEFLLAPGTVQNFKFSCQQEHMDYEILRMNRVAPSIINLNLDEKGCVQQFWRKMAQLVRFYPRVNWISSPELIAVTGAVQRLGTKQGIWAFSELYQALLADLEGCKLSSSVEEKSPSSAKIGEEEDTPFDTGPTYWQYQKAIERMCKQGQCLYFPDMRHQPVIIDFSWLKTELNKIVSHGDGKIPYDQEKMSDTKMAMLFKLLEKCGILIQRPRQYLLVPKLPAEPDIPMEYCWSDCPDSNEVQLSKGCVIVEDIPLGFFPVLLRECSKIAANPVLWQNGLLAQHGAVTLLIERRETTAYELEEFLEPIRLKTPMKKGPMKKKGGKKKAPMKKAPIKQANSKLKSSLLEDDDDDDEIEAELKAKALPEHTNIIYIAVRATKMFAEEEVRNQHALMSCLWSTLLTYVTIMKYVCQKFKVYCQFLTPCPHSETCHSRTKFYQHNMLSNRDATNVVSRLKCAQCKKDVKVEEILGPNDFSFVKPGGIAPTHTLDQVKFDTSPHVDYSRCFLCGNCAYEGIDCPQNGTHGETIYHCGCQRNAQMCSKCGVCTRCTKYLNKVQTALQPGLGSSRPFTMIEDINESSVISVENLSRGNFISNRRLNVQSGTKWAAMDPVHFNFFEVTLLPAEMERNKVTVGLSKVFGKPLLEYHLQTGVIADHEETGVKEHKDDKWIVSEACTVRVQMRFDRDDQCKAMDTEKVKIEISKAGEVIYTKKTRLQRLCGTIGFHGKGIEVFVNAPGIKEAELTPSRRIKEEMLVEIKDPATGVHHLAELASSTHDNQLYTAVMKPEGIESFNISPYSDRLFPLYYSYYNKEPNDYWTEALHEDCPQCKEKNEEKASSCEFCGTSLKKMELISADLSEEDLNSRRAPIWLFSETQRTNMKPYYSSKTDGRLEKWCRNFLQGTAKTACTVAQNLPLVEEKIFAESDFNYSGVVGVIIPNLVNQHLVKMLPHVRQEALTKGTERKLHQLCYSRGDAGEMLKVRADYKLPKEEDGKYWQLHLVDSPGIEVPEDNLQGMLAVLIACHAIMGSQKVELPSHKKLLPDLDITEDEAEELIQTVIHLCTQSLMMTMLYHEVNGFGQYVLAKLLPDHAYIFKDEITTLNEGGILHEHETMTGDTHLLCKAHLNCYLLEAGLTEFPMEKFQIDGTSYTRLIRSLRIPQNDIKALPEDFFPSFPSLVEFDVSHNKLSILPKGIGKCKKLCGINVKKNNLQNLPEELLELKDQPLRLEISENPIHSLPEVICHLENLQRLLANNLLLTSLPENFGNLKNLNYLTLKHNCLQVLPSSFKNLKKLKSLSLEGFPWFKHKPNGFLSQEDFGEFLKGTYADKWLEMHKEDKASLYEFFDEDSNGLLDEKEIAKLNACLFHIFPRFRGTEEESGIPAEILELENLEYLDLQFQGITHIPDAISKLHKLQELVVSFNPCLETISPLAGRLPLKRLVLDECPSIRTPPKEIISKGFQTIYAYLRRLISGSVECKRTKLMLVGLGGVGKTSLVKAIMSGGGVGETQEAIPQVTDGIDICTWTVTREKETVSYSVWDFAGQTVYYNTHQFFLSDRAVYLLLWNIRQGHEHAGLDFWLNSIAVHAPKAPILVVGTHLDQVSKVEIPVEEMQQKYSQIKGFHFVSSHSGQGIKDLQEMLLDVTLEQPYIGEQIPQVWLNLEKEIIKLRTTESVVSYVSLEDLALTKSGIYDKSEVSQAVQFLHELGSLQHFDNNFLKSHVVINPQWIVDVMSCVVSVNDSHIKDGYFNHTDIPKVWEDYPADLHWWLLRLTEEYDLTFQLPDKPVNLVPCLLPEKQPHFDWPELDRENGEREAKMIYKFDYLPAGLFNRAQVRLYEFSDSSVIWKRGSRLKKNDHIALLTQFRDSELHVKVQGTTPENVLFLVHEVFEGLITESFQGVVYDYLMPCPDCSKAHARDPHMFSASSIRRATQLKAPFLQCTKYFHVIPLTDLHSMMPPESSTDYDLQLVQTVRGLTDLRKDMSADIFISYCAKDVPKKSEKRVAPVDVCRDLEEAGYRCWFQEDPSSQSLEVTAIALRDARVFLACISDNYIEDQDCCAMFKYACTTLRKSIVLVVLGDSMNWQTSQIGLLVAGEVYVNMQQKDKYTSKLEELAKKLDMNTLLKKDEAIDYPPVFISYAWANSARAVELGTPEKEGAAGFGDPRDYKDFLEKNGIKCWLDVEQVGANGLFEDIAVGLQNAKLVVACISDQYAESTNCNMEFRFAKTALNLPIIVVTVGRGQMWRKSEVGMLSINYPVVSHDDTDQLLKLVKENLPSEVQQPVSNETKEKKKEKEQANQQQKNTSFQELYELAQRKFLRQVAKLADSFNMEAYPRLVVIDHMDTEETEEGEKESEKENSKDAEKDEEKEKDEERKLSTPHAFSKIKKDHPHGQKHCYRVLCEHEQGWHVAGDPIPAPNMNDTFLHKLIPYLARIMAIVKHSKHITLNCISGEEGEQFLKWLEETPRNAVSEWQDVYRDLLQEVLKADKDSTMAGLARCHLPSGKVAWLCEGHRSQGRITVLSSTGSSAVSAPDAGKENFMLKALMAPDNQLTLKYKAHNETQMAAAMKDKKKAETTQKPKSGKTSRPSETGPPSVNPLVAATANAMTLDAVQKTAAAGNNSQRTKARFKAAGIAAAVAGQKRNSSQTCVIL